MRLIWKFPEAFVRRSRTVIGWRFCASMLGMAMLVLAATGAQAGDIKTIGVIVGDLGNPFFEQIARSVEDVAVQKIGPSTKVIVRSSGYDLNRQIEQINAMIKQKIDLLILNAADTDRIGPAVRRARAAAIVVVAIDVGAEGAQATVTSDNRSAGQLACEYLAKQIEGKGDVLILSGPPTTSIIERLSGCQSVFSNYPGITILEDNEDCGGTVEGGLSYMTTVLTKYPQIDGVFAVNDLVGIGANIAGQLTGRDGFAIVTVDGSPPGIEALKNPRMDIIASVAQNPRQMAEKAVSLGFDLLKGDTVVENTTEIVPVNLITRENFGTYAGWSAR